jgi:hypothetical protein
MSLLREIISCEDEDNNICFDRQMTNEEKGVVGSLVKKGFIYDSFADMADMADMGGGYQRHNFFPTNDGINTYNQNTTQHEQ